jgi:hypothetical protein
MLAHGFSKRALMDMDIADRIGATLVIGEPQALAALKKLSLPLSPERTAAAAAAEHQGLTPLAEWFRSGEHGRSSKAMAKRIFGLPRNAGEDTPRDASDLRRCLQFVEATQCADRVELMRDVSPQWNRLASGWADLTARFNADARQGVGFAQTEALLEQLLRTKNK